MKHLKYLILLSLFTNHLISQNEKMVIEGAVVISDNDDPNPAAGTIKWDGSDFLGFDGTTWKSLTCCCDDEQPIDCNGNSYQTVVIGNQTWFAENLRANCYNDGTPIPWALSSSEWNSLSPSGSNSGAAGVYPGYGATSTPGVGALYNWFVTNAAYNGAKNVCPVGWHVPTDADFEELILTIDPLAIGSQLNNNDAGGKLKTTGTVQAGNGLWDDPNLGATDMYQFSAEPSFSRFGAQSTQTGNFWSQDLSNGNPPIVGGIATKSRSLSNTHARFAPTTNDAATPNHIRCVKD